MSSQMIFFFLKKSQVLVSCLVFLTVEKKNQQNISPTDIFPVKQECWVDVQ